MPLSETKEMPDVGFGLKSGFNDKVTLCKRRANATFASMIAKVLPMQLRTPYANGKYPCFADDSPAMLRNRSGKKDKNIQV